MMFEEPAQASLRRIPIDEARAAATSTLRRGSRLALQVLDELDTFGSGWVTNPAAVGVGRPVTGEPRRVRLPELDELHLSLLRAFGDTRLVVAEDEHARRTDRLRATCAYIGERVVRWRCVQDEGATTIMRPSELGVPLCMYVCRAEPRAVGLRSLSTLSEEHLTELVRSVTGLAVPWDDSDALVFLSRVRRGQPWPSRSPRSSVPYLDDGPQPSMS